MANIHETIAEVEKLNPDLAKQIKRYVKDHSYGLVFEQNLPDSVRLWTKKPVKYDTVHILPPRGKFDTAENYKEWHVSDIVDGIATLKCDEEVKFVSVEDIVPVVGHKGVIYPGLKVIDKVERGNPDDPYHVLINAENYHALQMLRYAYAGKVDCIYIDPPYNTGAKDWKYNNNYVGQDDQYRHSKWLAMMERRLRLAKDLLNPDNSVMIVTIDEKEYLRLGMLLEQMFPEANIQMVTNVITPIGISRGDEFARCEEYLYILRFGNASVLSIGKKMLNEDADIKSLQKTNVVWKYLRRGSSNNGRRVDRPNLFYPLIFSLSGDFIDTGDSYYGQLADYKYLSDYVYVFPISPNGEELSWNLNQDSFKDRLKNGYIDFGDWNDGHPNIKYLTSGVINDINNRNISIVGYKDNGAVILKKRVDSQTLKPLTVWNQKAHNAGVYGTLLNKNFLVNRSFPYPKSLYAVEDTLRFFVADKPDALIVDFFAGSGTTAHATMLLNHLDGGHRQCISITNNEIGPDNEKELTMQGFRPTDKEWQDKGIANYITWERIKAAITGIATNGEPIKGDYKFTEEFPMSDGFRENAIFCELTYEKLWDIRLDRAFNAVAPILWAMAGAKGKIIEKLGKGYATTDNYAVLFKYDAVNKFVEVVNNKPSIEHVFVVTDDQHRYLEVLKKINWINPKNVHRLYESYLKSFEILGEGGLD